MGTPQRTRAKRLRHELEILEGIRCPAIQWTTEGNPITRLIVNYNIRSIVGLNAAGRPIYRNTHKVAIIIPHNFPMPPGPEARMCEGYLPIFHPNVWPNGRICTNAHLWRVEETLSELCLQIACIFQFDPKVSNPKDAANTKARVWYLENVEKGLFPTDTQVLPIIPTVDEEAHAAPDFEIVEIRQR